ncbi:MAG: PIN domain-containing protein [archaeon]|nr:PIN domain-containing protein [archaeon]
MEFIVDANIVFSILIKEGFNAKLFFHPKLIVYAPAYMLEELKHYKEFLISKTQRSDEELEWMLKALKSIMIIVPEEEYSQFYEEAKKISPDPDDIQYFALALKLRCGIWSNDKELKKQSRIDIYDSKEVFDWLNWYA